MKIQLTNINKPDFDSTIGDNAKFNLNSLAVFNLQPIDRNDPQQVEQRINDYLNIVTRNDMKPSVAGLALAFKTNRQTLTKWVNGLDSTFNEESRKILYAAFCYLNSLIEDYMSNGKINPASGIFLMKNNFGYKDIVENVITNVDQPQLKTEDIIEDINNCLLIDEKTLENSDFDD